MDYVLIDENNQWGKMVIFSSGGVRASFPPSSVDTMERVLHLDTVVVKCALVQFLDSQDVGLDSLWASCGLLA